MIKEMVMVVKPRMNQPQKKNIHAGAHATEESHKASGST